MRIVTASGPAHHGVVHARNVKWSTVVIGRPGHGRLRHRSRDTRLALEAARVGDAFVEIPDDAPAAADADRGP